MPEMTPPSPEDPAALGPYTLVGRLGQGGYGVVYLAETPASERVAVKLLRTNLAEAGGERERFAREAAAAKQVARFCTAQVLDADIAGDRPYIVSEYVDGPSLQALVTDRGPLAGGALDRLAIGMATALVAIHQAGIVHRDLKPPNVLLGPDGPRVIDFGIARIMDQAATATGHSLGTPAYMAPEQVQGRAVTPAADVFAWGATVVFAATGTPPFGRDSLAALAYRIVNEPPELGALTGRLRDLVTECLNKDPARRPSASTLLMSLLGHDAAPAAGRERTAILAEGVTAAVPAAYVPAGGAPTTVATRPAPPRRRWVYALAGLAGAALLAGGVTAALMALRGDHRTPPSARSTATVTATRTTEKEDVASGGKRHGERGHPATPAPTFSISVSSCDLGTSDTTCTVTLTAQGGAFDWTGGTEHPLGLSSTGGHLEPGGTYTVTITLYPNIPRTAGSGTVTFTAAGDPHTVQVGWEAEPSPDPSAS